MSIRGGRGRLCRAEAAAVHSSIAHVMWGLVESEAVMRAPRYPPGSGSSWESVGMGEPLRVREERRVARASSRAAEGSGCKAWMYAVVRHFEMLVRMPDQSLKRSIREFRVVMAFWVVVMRVASSAYQRLATLSRGVI